jgi:hypothetical protein
LRFSKQPKSRIDNGSASLRGQALDFARVFPDRVQTALALVGSGFCRTVVSPALEKGRSRMQDALMLLYTVIFFAVAFLYVKACQKLR